MVRASWPAERARHQQLSRRYYLRTIWCRFSANSRCVLIVSSGALFLVHFSGFGASRRSHLRKMRGGASKSARLVDVIPSCFCFLSLASSSECNLHALAVPQAETYLLRAKPCSIYCASFLHPRVVCCVRTVHMYGDACNSSHFSNTAAIPRHCRSRAPSDLRVWGPQRCVSLPIILSQQKARILNNEISIY